MSETTDTGEDMMQTYETYEQWQLDQYQSALEALRPELARLGIPAEEEAPDKPGLRRRRATVTMVRDLIARQEASCAGM